MTQRRVGPEPSVRPLLLFLAATILLIPLDRPLFGLPLGWRLWLGIAALAVFAYSLRFEPSPRRRRYLALGLPLIILALAPIDTDTSTPHALALAFAFAAVLIVPWLLLRHEGLITFRFFPRKLDRLDLLYTLSAIPLSWLAFQLYFGVLSPEVPFNWSLPPKPDNESLWRLFMGINAVGIWDELFFVNVCFAVLRGLFPLRIANPAQTVIYTSVLYDMAFSGWGPVFVAALALTQGAMYERSKVLVYVLVVHLIVDYFLFQAVVTTYYPQLDVWWH